MELVALYKQVIGLDVHQEQIAACALIEECDGTTRIEQRQFGAFKKDRRALAEWVAQLCPDEVVMESTGIYWKIPYTALGTVRIHAKVVNARHVKNVPGRKTDISDVHGQSARAMIKALIANKTPHEVLEFWLAFLQILPGIDLIGAAMLLVEIGTDMDAFGSADRLASWVGICPGNNESAGKRKSGRVRKGNAYVRRLLCEFAHAASRTTSVFKAKFQSLCVRRGYKRSIVALGHKMLRSIFFMFKRGEYYRDCATDYEALSIQRNVARWIKALTRFGFIKPTEV